MLVEVQPNVRTHKRARATHHSSGYYPIRQCIDRRSLNTPCDERLSSVLCNPILSIAVRFSWAV